MSSAMISLPVYLSSTHGWRMEEVVVCHNVNVNVDDARSSLSRDTLMWLGKHPKGRWIILRILVVHVTTLILSNGREDLHRNCQEIIVGTGQICHRLFASQLPVAFVEVVQFQVAPGFITEVYATRAKAILIMATRRPLECRGAQGLGHGGKRRRRADVRHFAKLRTAFDGTLQAEGRNGRSDGFNDGRTNCLWPAVLLVVMRLLLIASTARSSRLLWHAKTACITD